MKTNSRFTRTRLAPTPSGYLHLGNLLSFVLTTELAKRFGAKVLLRIDDMDRDRVRGEYVQDIFDTLNFMEISWDEGPQSVSDFQQAYSQLNRMALYAEALEKLAEKNLVFACDCSRSIVANSNASGSYPGTCLHRGWPLNGEEMQWRLNTEGAGLVSIRELGSGRTAYTLTASVQFAQLRRRDGKPAYQLCSVVDDLVFDVDLIVRGRDLFDSSVLQVYLSECMPANSFSETVFFHHPLLLQEGVKMSKSEGASSVFQLRKQGLKRAEVYQRIALYAGLEPSAKDAAGLFELLAHYAGLA
jgi:glutamyl/glutaminyl-tRNA synthetase